MLIKSGAIILIAVNKSDMIKKQKSTGKENKGSRTNIPVTDS